jgi:ADP-ribose pyrophosphatase
MEKQNPETKILSHEEIYRGIIVTLHVDQVQLPSGRPGIREVVHHPGGVVIVPVLEDGRLVLVRQFRYPLKKYILEFPAGKLDSNQTPLETITRELEEEAGYRAETITHEFSFYSTPGISDEIIHLFIASGLCPVSQRLEEGEHITIEKYTLDECLDKIRTGEIADGKTLLGILWYGRRFFNI